MSLSIHSDDHFMKMALQEAQNAFEEGEIPVGAIITANNRIIAKAHNQVQRLNDVTAHAEMLAITAAQNYLGSKYLNDCTLYVTLEPCIMCGGALYWSQLNKLVIGAKDTKRGYRSKNVDILHPKTTVVQGVLQEDCEMLMLSFFNKMRGNNF
ncbi:MAG: tRNA(adenine34) deaminase [Cyclobacteriaceae bacterium]|jgi:tRNA(adenine34) deaminase